MKEYLLKYIEDKQLFGQFDRILLAVSGGIDSVVMVNLFSEARIQFAVAHCNFMLRGEESAEDEVFVKNLADQFNVPFFVKSFDTETYAKDNQLSIQMAARELRYDWFDHLLEEKGYDFIATAHHRDDVLESLLLNLTKGTGISGLQGIRSKLGRVVRPVLFASRKDIADYAADKKLQWREDSSNQSNQYQRNLIRNEVIPQMKLINPNLENTLVHTLDRLQAAEEIFDTNIKKIKEEALFRSGIDVWLHVRKMQAEGLNSAILFEILKEWGFSYVQAREIMDGILSNATGKKYLSGGYRLNLDRDYLLISPIRDANIRERLIWRDTEDYQNDFFKTVFRIYSTHNFKIPADRNQACLDLERLEFPLKVRRWQPGDRFFPLGMKHPKKVSDFLIDEKVPLNIKDRVCVLTSGEEIAWLIGYRIDERFKVTEDTQNIFKAVKLEDDQPI